MKHYSAMIAGGFLAAAAVTSAFAQKAAPATEQPTPVGTSQQTANEANRKAMARSDTATVVRTGPSVTGKVDDAAAKTKEEVRSAKLDVKHKAKRAKAKVSRETNN